MEIRKGQHVFLWKGSGIQPSRIEALYETLARNLSAKLAHESIFQAGS